MFGIPVAILANLPAILGGVEAAWAAISKARTAAQQTKPWTPEEEKAFEDLQAHLFSQPHWKVQDNSRSNPSPAAPVDAAASPPAAPSAPVVAGVPVVAQSAEA